MVYPTNIGNLGVAITLASPVFAASVITTITTASSAVDSNVQSILVVTTTATSSENLPTSLILRPICGRGRLCRRPLNIHQESSAHDDGDDAEDNQDWRFQPPWPFPPSPKYEPEEMAKLAPEGSHLVDAAPKPPAPTPPPDEKPKDKKPFWPFPPFPDWPFGDPSPEDLEVDQEHAAYLAQSATSNPPPPPDEKPKEKKPFWPFPPFPDWPFGDPSPEDLEVDNEHLARHAQSAASKPPPPPDNDDDEPKKPFWPFPPFPDWPFDKHPDPKAKSDGSKSKFGDKMRMPRPGFARPKHQPLSIITNVVSPTTLTTAIKPSTTTNSSSAATTTETAHANDRRQLIALPYDEIEYILKGLGPVIDSLTIGQPTTTSATTVAPSTATPTPSNWQSSDSHAIERRYAPATIPLFAPNSPSELKIIVTASHTPSASTPTRTPTVSVAPVDTEPEEEVEEEVEEEAEEEAEEEENHEHAHLWPAREGLYEGFKFSMGDDVCTITDGMAIRDTDSAVLSIDGEVLGHYGVKPDEEVPATEEEFEGEYEDEDEEYST